MNGVSNLLRVSLLCASLLNASTLGLRTQDAVPSARKTRGLVASSERGESDIEMSSLYVKIPEAGSRHRLSRDVEERIEESTVVEEETSTESIVSLEEPIQDAMRMVMKLVMPRMMELAYDPELSTECLSSLMKIWKGLTSYELWAMKMLDSSGRPPAGLMQGNIADMGAYEECLSISTPPSSGPHFEGQYCSLFVKVLGNPFVDSLTAKVIDDLPILRQFVKNVTVMKALQAESYVMGLRMGVCIPSACSGEELRHLVTKFVGKYGGVATVPTCRVKTPVVLNTVQIAVISFVGSLGVLIAVASVVDMYHVRQRADGKGSPATRSFPMQLLLSFSAVSNTAKLFCCEVEPGSTRARQQCIDGIRLIGAMWVTLVHTYILVEPNTLGRGLGFLEMMTERTFAVISNGSLSVDTFFLISGFIVTQMVLSRKKNSSLFLFAMTAYSRYIRLSVPALFLVAIVFVYPLLVSGPVADQLMNGIIAPCEKHWWDVLTHTTNFRGIRDMCVPHLWYVAADFQMYVFFLVFIVALRRRPRFGLTGAVLTALASCIGTSLQTYIYGLQPFPHLQFSSFNHTMDAFEQVFFKPYSHMAPFAVGIITAYLFMEKPHPKLNVMQKLTGWAAATVVGVVVIFGVHPWTVGGEYSAIMGSLYAGLNHLAWSLAMSWVLYVCCTGNGGPVNAFLSQKAFVPLSRLSFGVYLIHMLVLLVKPLTTRILLQWTHWMLVKDFLGSSVISFAFAYLFFLFCEAPLNNLNKMLTGKLFPTTTRDMKAPSTKHYDTLCKGDPIVETKKGLCQQPIQPLFVVPDDVVGASFSKL